MQQATFSRHVQLLREQSTSGRDCTTLVVYNAPGTRECTSLVVHNGTDTRADRKQTALKQITDLSITFDWPAHMLRGLASAGEGRCAPCTMQCAAIVL